MNVVIATDGSPQSARVIAEANRLLPLKQATIYLVSVAPLADAVSTTLPIGVGGPASFGGSAVPEVIAQLEQNAHHFLAVGLGLLQELGLTAELVERLGEPTDEILAVAAEVHADVIVVGSHGNGAFKRLFLGSVSDGVLHHAAAAVLLIQPARRADSK